MVAFPQLSTGAVAQLPFQRETRYRARRNDMQGGTSIQIGDPDFEERAWDLTFRELSDSEWGALQQLHDTVKGRLNVFTFLEPGANLLAWSESFTQTPWQASGAPLENRPDPFGGTAATQLDAGSSVTQTIAAPANYSYSGSAWVKATSSGALLRVSDGAANTFEQSILPTGQWFRVVVQYSGSSATDTLELALVSGGSPLHIFGAQLEPQAAASAYKRTSARGGVYPNTRFDQDTLIDEATGPGRHSTRVRLIWTPSQS